MGQTTYWPGATLAFLAELASLAALAAAGAALPVPGPLRVAAAVALPAAAAVLWGLFAAPRAVSGSPVAATATTVLVEGGAVAALVLLRRPVLAALLLVAVLLGRLLTARHSAGVTTAG
jgi:Protein of unknown function (DUF2568)